MGQNGSFKLKDPVGNARARNIGVSICTGDIFIFMDMHTTPGKNWVVPIVRNLNINYRRIVQPIVKEIKSEAAAQMTANTPHHFKIVMRNWGLEVGYTNDDQTDMSALLHGVVFAVTRQWWDEIGPLEGEMGFGVQYVEYSLRNWLCGGELYFARDSLFGYHSDMDPTTTSERQSSYNMIFEGLLGKKQEERSMSLEKVKMKAKMVEMYFEDGARNLFYEYWAERLPALKPELEKISGREISNGVIRQKEIDVASVRDDFSLIQQAQAQDGGGTPGTTSLQTKRECYGFNQYIRKWADEFLHQQMVSTTHFEIRPQGCANCCFKSRHGVEKEPYAQLDVETCSPDSVHQKFFWMYGNGIRSVFLKACLDAAFPSVPGAKPIFYACMKTNRNQEWQLIDESLKWGSWCL